MKTTQSPAAHNPRIARVNIGRLISYNIRQPERVQALADKLAAKWGSK